jgi:hypothetical protein
MPTGRSLFRHRVFHRRPYRDAYGRPSRRR